jgi:hypothetical protein
VEDHALCEDGEDHGELVVLFSRSINAHLFTAFAAPVADAMRSALLAA